MQSTVPVIPLIKTKRKKGKNSGALKKTRKVLAALVDAQLKINKQQGIHLIKPPADPNKEFTYYAPNPKGDPIPIPEITQDYEDNNTLEPKILYPYVQWEEEAVEVEPRQSQCLMQTANVMSCPPAGIS